MIKRNRSFCDECGEEMEKIPDEDIAQFFSQDPEKDEYINFPWRQAGEHVCHHCDLSSIHPKLKTYYANLKIHHLEKLLEAFL